MHLDKYIKRLKPKTEGNNIWISVGKTEVREIMRELKSLGISRISFITGVDTGKGMDVIYHLVYKEKTINLRISLDKKNLAVDTITDIYPGANLFERELYEMLGINVRKHPNLKMLFLSEGSPKNPMRKS